MRVLVAGGAGFIGSHLCRALVSRGDEVVCLDDLSSGDRANVADLDLERFRLVVADVSDPPSVWLPWPHRLDRPRFDLVIHLASPASPVDYTQHPMATLAANSTGTSHLLQMARDHRARFILASTSEVYGDPLVHPQPETYWGNVDPIGPRSMYDEGKRFSEALVTAARDAWGVNAAIVRLFNTYGPGMRLDDGRVVTAFIDAVLDGRHLPIHGDGHQTRSFCYIDDLVSGLMHVVDDPALDGLVANIGNPQEVEVNALASAVSWALTGDYIPVERLPAREGDPRQRCPSIARMTGRYGWEPRVRLDEGLARTVAWFRERVERETKEAVG